MKENRTKIIATIGPSCFSKTILEKMIKAGMDCIRLNFSHGVHEEYARVIKNVRSLSKSLGKEVAIIQDLQGAKIRVGKIANKEGISVEKGQTITLGNRKIPLQFKNLYKYLKTGERIFINDGAIELEVLQVKRAKKEIVCLVKIGGKIKSNKGLNAPDSDVGISTITAKDRRDLKFGLKHNVDYVALSFVGRASDIKELRALIDNNTKIIAKIERQEALRNLEEIIEATDAVMVARGDLGIEVSAAMVPVHQKRIIASSIKHGKPVIVATQMFSSMIENPKPTRAEISDAATTIFEHADAMMVSNETSVGKYPIRVVRTMASVATAVEREIMRHPELTKLSNHDLSLTDATCRSAAQLANDITATYIIAITKSGYTAREIARNRPQAPIIVFTPSRYVARRLTLVWGVQAVFVERIALTNPITQIKKTLLKKKLAIKGEEIVIVNTSSDQNEKLLTSTLI